MFRHRLRNMAVLILLFFGFVCEVSEARLFRRCRRVSRPAPATSNSMARHPLPALVELSRQDKLKKQQEHKKAEQAKQQADAFGSEAAKQQAKTNEEEAREKKEKAEARDKAAQDAQTKAQQATKDMPTPGDDSTEVCTLEDDGTGEKNKDGKPAEKPAEKPNEKVAEKTPELESAKADPPPKDVSSADVLSKDEINKQMAAEPPPAERTPQDRATEKVVDRLAEATGESREGARDVLNEVTKEIYSQNPDGTQSLSPNTLEGDFFQKNPNLSKSELPQAAEAYYKENMPPPKASDYLSVSEPSYAQDLKDWNNDLSRFQQSVSDYASFQNVPDQKTAQYSVAVNTFAPMGGVKASSIHSTVAAGTVLKQMQEALPSLGSLFETN